MIAFIITLIAIAVIGILQGVFIALIVTLVALLIGYFTTIYVALGAVVLVTASLTYLKVKKK